MVDVDVASEHSLHNFGEGDDEENDQFLAEYFTKTPEHEDNRSMFRPMFSDVQMVGFFRADRSTQTEESEVASLKEMTTVIGQLLKDAKEMKRDIHFTKHVLEADFATKLQNKATDMYTTVNYKLDDTERMHRDKVGTIRRAFRQQLADAIARLHTYHNQSKFQQMSSEEEHRKENAQQFNAALQGLQATIQRQQALISMLEGQIAERNETPAQIIDRTDENEPSTESTPQPEPEPEPEPEVERPPSRSESVLRELDSLQDQVDDLHKYIKRKEREIQSWEEVNDDLKKDIKALENELENERQLSEKLKSDREDLIKNAQKDAAASQRQLEKQKLKIKKEAEEKMKNMKEEALVKAKQSSENLQSQEQEKYNKLLEEKKQLEALLMKEIEKGKKVPKEVGELEKVKRNEEKLMYDVAKLRRELEKAHSTWEKKFHILQQSLHALKDESYLRQTLQKQAATLHTASISYAYDSPMGITAANHVASQPYNKKPLPNINKNAKSPQDFISYTVSAQSDRATALFPVDENQIMSDDELPSDILPIKSIMSKREFKTPAASPVADDQESMRTSSTKSHVVVLPSMKA